MAFDISNKAHVSAYITRLTKVANDLFDIQKDLNDFAAISSINGVAAALEAGGAQFPSGITVTPAAVDGAQFALNTVSNALNTAMSAGIINNINAVREAIGVLAGTG